MALFQRELRDVASTSCQLTNGQVAVTFSDDNLLRFKIKINPNSGLYQGGPLYEFTIRASDNYPRSPPIVISCSYILHPNVNEYGEVYLQCLVDWTSRAYDLTFVVKSLLELFHRPNFSVITNEEVTDWTDVEFIRNVSAWKLSQTQQTPPSEVTYRNALGLGSRISLIADTGHRDGNCECRNEYIVVTNSRRPPQRRPPLRRPGSARQARHQQNDHIQASVSMIDLSDVYDSIRHIEPDYEIRSVSSEEDSVLERDITPSSTRHSPSRPSNRPSRQTRFSLPRQDLSSHSDSRLTNYRLADPWQSYSLQSDSRHSSRRQSAAASRVSSRLQSSHDDPFENMPLSRNETPYLARNRNRDDSKPDFRKDINNFL